MIGKGRYRYIADTCDASYRGGDLILMHHDVHEAMD
jgi:hypothetical protein